MTGLDERGEPQSSISALVIAGFSSFKALLATLEDSPTESSAATSHLARLKLWAGNLGAHRSSGTHSLEYRLRDASSIRNHIASLLQSLCKFIDEATSTAKGDTSSAIQLNDATDLELDEYFQDDDSLEDSEISRILADIGHTIDCLLRLSITIRNPAPHDRFKSRAGADVVGIFEQWDTKHVQDKFPAAGAKISERLGRAIAWRRQYFKYREEHRAKLGHGLEADGEHDEREKSSTRGKSTIASSIPNHLKESFQEFSDLADDNRSEVSGTSYAPSTVDPTQLRVPPLPKEHAEGPFECPFCRMVISINTRKEWNSHISGHLESLALFALPNTATEGDAEDESEDDNSALEQGSANSQSSSLNVGQRHIWGHSKDWEAEFEAALDDAIEAAYDDGYEADTQIGDNMDGQQKQLRERRPTLWPPSDSEDDRYPDRPHDDSNNRRAQVSEELEEYPSSTEGEIQQPILPPADEESSGARRFVVVTEGHSSELEGRATVANKTEVPEPSLGDIEAEQDAGSSGAGTRVPPSDKKARIATPRVRPPAKHARIPNAIPERDFEFSHLYYGGGTDITVASSRPRAKGTSRPTSYYGVSGPPKGNESFYTQQSLLSSNYPPPPRAVPPPPSGVYDYPTRDLDSPDVDSTASLTRFPVRRRPVDINDARGAMPPPPRHPSRSPLGPLILPSTQRRLEKLEDDRRAMPPPPRRPAAARPTTLAFRPPAGLTQEQFEATYRRDRPRVSRTTESDESLDEEGEGSKDHAEYNASEQRVRQGTLRREEASAGGGPLADEVSRTRERGRRSSRGNRSTRSSGSESDFRRTATTTTTTTTTRSSVGDEDVTIRVKGNAMLKVGEAEIQCLDGTEINMLSRASQPGFLGRRGEYSIQAEPVPHIVRPPARPRPTQSSQLGSEESSSFSRSLPKYEPPESGDGSGSFGDTFPFDIPPYPAYPEPPEPGDQEYI
ncbi:hypothetical protein OQA88_10233 [Cercophora sp. LCS_1]